MKYEHIALSASAGSGKTFTLSVRFIALLLDGAPIADVVALTFTKKAVGEMKERIEEVFCQLEHKTSELAALCELLGCGETELLRRRDALLEQFLSAELKIYTFDSFFAQILRLFASFLGLRPDFELTEQQEKSEWFLESLSAEQGREIAQILAEFNISLSEFLRSLGVIYSNYSGRFAELANAPAASLCELFSNLRADLACENKFISKWLSELVREEDFYKESALKLLSSPTSDKQAAKSPAFAAARERLADALVQNLRAKEQNLLKLCFKYAQIYHAAAVKKHQEINLLSFEDVAIYVHKILQNKELKDLFYFRLNSNLSHLLIDEFQDTSIIQYEIIRPIVEEITAGIGLGDAPKSFFYVGDKKQSIYSFRGANQAVFDLFLSEAKFGVKLRNLGTNYRSYAEVVGFCNEIFAPAYGAEFIPATAAKPAGGSVRAFECESAEEQSFALVLASIRQLEGQICVLVRSNAIAAALSEYLAEHGVQAASATARPLVNDLSVRVLLEYAKFCVLGDAAYGAFVRLVLGFLPPRLELDLCKSAQKTLLYLAQQLRLPMSENLAEFIFSARDELLANLYEESPALAASELNARVLIMTVHKSKGLQFENLICLHRATRGGADGGLKLVYDFGAGAWDGYLKHPAAARKLRAERDAEYASKLAAAEAAEAGDELNVVYVAYTRAIKNLVIIKEDKCELPVALPLASADETAAWLAAGGCADGAAGGAAGAAGAGGAAGGEAAGGVAGGEVPAPSENPLFSQKPVQIHAPSENPLFLQKLPTPETAAATAPSENPLFSQKLPAPSENPFFLQKLPAPRQNPFFSQNPTAKSPRPQEIQPYDFFAPIAAQKKPEKFYSAQLELGRAFHYFCELSDFRAQSAEACIRLALERFRAADAAELRERAYKLLGCADFMRLLEGKFFVKELAFMHGGRLGRVDLIAYCADEICIIDYKSSAYEHKYLAQLERYEQALRACKFAEMVGLPCATPVKKFLLVYERGEFCCRQITDAPATDAPAATATTADAPAAATDAQQSARR